MTASHLPVPLTLHGPRIRLQPLRMEHIYTHFRWNNDPELNRLDSEVPFEREPFRVFKRRFEVLAHRPSPCALDFEIIADDGTLIGVASADRLCDTNRRARVSVTLGDRTAWGRGFGTETLRTLIGYLIAHRGLHRITAEAFAFNGAWKRLLERCGFQREGCFRDHLHREGAFWDKDVYALLATDTAAQAMAEACLPPRRATAAWFVETHLSEAA